MTENTNKNFFINKRQRTYTAFNHSTYSTIRAVRSTRIYTLLWLIATDHYFRTTTLVNSLHHTKVPKRLLPLLQCANAFQLVLKQYKHITSKEKRKLKPPNFQTVQSSTLYQADSKPSQLNDFTPHTNIKNHLQPIFIQKIVLCVYFYGFMHAHKKMWVSMTEDSFKA